MVPFQPCHIHHINPLFLINLFKCFHNIRYKNLLIGAWKKFLRETLLRQSPFIIFVSEVLSGLHFDLLMQDFIQALSKHRRMRRVYVRIIFRRHLESFRNWLAFLEGYEPIDVGQLALVWLPVHYVVNLFYKCPFLYCLF